MRKTQSKKQEAVATAGTNFAATLSELEKVVADLESDIV